MTKLEEILLGRDMSQGDLIKIIKELKKQILLRKSRNKENHEFK